MVKSAREIVLVGVVLSLWAPAFTPAWSQAPGNAQPPAAAAPKPPTVPAIPVDGRLAYRGFTIDATEIRSAPQYNAIMTSIVHQIDIVADCGAKPEILQFFRTQIVLVKHAPPGGMGHFNSNSPGVTLADIVAEPQKPILLHELLHAYHFRVMPGAFRNTEILAYFDRARSGGAYPQGAYVLKDVQEFFAVTASLYLWGNVDRPPNTRDKLKAAQPVYYAWLGQLFGVAK
jgi:hypothetical protein